ncbi:hypothetical protein COX00_04785 [Candidatus Uhrbacteria bacterium CG22_combo_CG10-13_8_21_14_all_47_17]|uniref:Glycosyltransferase 2-like domain-containing protein n=1 Tax=Candidatus Uhrbacteria bacterium CG22_combo_CG10-13_8_21_14_all_47_17 TaxID=1975041 RepID=A0A2H0BR43_9BACT|nr:MAG: hypothetical protein COX00_04785 [Candidatus Uhrbacteria bacterium CG22_combo_CG10-13_8_21_14_all_47_17]
MFVYQALRQGERKGLVLLDKQPFPMLPKIAVIYLTYPTPNWQRDIDRFMHSFTKVRYPKDRLELICVESKGKLSPVQPWFEKTWMPKSGAELPHISYIFHDEWIGFSGNNNFGVAKAKELGCTYVHLTNEDTDVDPDYLLRAVERAEADEQIAIVQSLLLLGEEREHVNSVGNDLHYLGFGYSSGYKWSVEQARAYFEKERIRNADLEIGYASGAAMLVRMSAIERMGGLFDERFFSYHEDTDAGLLARALGMKVVVEPSSIVYHYYEFGKSKKNFFWMERNRYVLLFSYDKLWTLFLLFPMMVVMDMALLFFSAKGGWFSEKLDVYREWFTRDYWAWIRERRARIKKMRIIGDKKLLRFCVGEIAFQEEGVKNALLEKVGNPLMKLYWSLVKNLPF